MILISAVGSRKTILFLKENFHKYFQVSSHPLDRNLDTKRALGIKKTILHIIDERRLKWFGHVARKPTSKTNGPKEGLLKGEKIK